MARFTWIAVLASLVACSGGGGGGSGGGTPEFAYEVPGRWSYQALWLVDSDSSTGCAGEVTIDGPDDALLGTWHDTYCSPPTPVRSGTVTGHVVGTSTVVLSFRVDGEPQSDEEWRWQDQIVTATFQRERYVHAILAHPLGAWWDAVACRPDCRE